VKGLDVLVAACSALRDRHQDFRVHLVGDGPLRASLEAEVASRKLGEHVKFVGSKHHKELGDWYRAADLTLLPSRSEGLPNVLRESLACGTPFVASRVGGIDEIAEGGAGMLVRPEQPEQLADAIVRALRERPSDAVLEGKSPGWPESAARLLEIVRPLLRSAADSCRGEPRVRPASVEQGPGRTQGSPLPMHVHGS
jgi:glycosyltransferase involved in cell wall biosynthesis